MHIIEKQLNLTNEMLPGHYNFVFIDIETDGLSHKNKIAIIGLLFITQKKPSGYFIQLFNDDYQSEKEILQELFKLLKEHEIDFYISFNGNSFDFPFMNARLKHYNVGLRLNKDLNIDLLKVVRRHKKELNLTNASLKDVEKLLGIDRKDVISGKDSVIMYHAYLESKDSRLLDSILLHNFDDIINMVPLLAIFDHINESLEDQLFPHKEINGVKWYHLESTVTSSHISYKYGAHNDTTLLEHHHETIGISYHKQSNSIELKLLLKEYPKANLTTLDVHHVLHKDFTMLSDEEKQNFVVKFNELTYSVNIERIGWDTLTQFLKNS